MIQQSKINSFINSITDAAAEKRSRVGAETQEILDAERALIEAKAKKTAEDYFRARTAEIRLEAGKRISESAAECRKEVFGRRNEISLRIRSAVAEKLNEFTASPEYGEFLKKSVDRIVDFLGEGNITLLFRPEDIGIGKEICKDCFNVTVSEDSSIRIGGIKGINSIVTMLVDDTLDSRLEGCKKWFEEFGSLYQYEVKIMPNNKVFGINGPVVTVADTKDFSMQEMVYVGNERLVGEVIGIDEKFTTIQVYEVTTGLTPGEPVEGTGSAMSVTLGPGIIKNIYDGIQRPLREIAEKSGAFIARGCSADGIDGETLWDVTVTVKVGDELCGGQIYATCPETPSIVHKVMVPPDLSGKVTFAAADGKYTFNTKII